MKGITILGSTGTIGVNTLDVISRHENDFRVVALTANRNVELMTEQCERWNPAYAVMCDADSADALRVRLDGGPAATEVLHGVENLEKDRRRVTAEI